MEKKQPEMREFGFLELPKRPHEESEFSSSEFSSLPSVSGNDRKDDLNTKENPKDKDFNKALTFTKECTFGLTNF